MTQRTTKQLKLRRGNTAEHSNFVGAVGEITVDTDLKTIRVHDGSTAGGFPLMQGDPTAYTIPWARVTNKPLIFSGNYDDLTNKPTIPVVPTAVSQLTNDAGYVVDSALSNFVTAQQLSNSTAGVVQLLTNSLAQKANVSQLPVVPTNVSAFNNDANYTTLNYVSAAIGGALDSINLDWANVTNKPTIPTDINQLSDANGLLGSGGSPANLGYFKIENNYIGTVDTPNTGGWGGYNMYLDPHGEGNSGISIPNNPTTADGAPLSLYNNGDGGIQLVTNRGALQIGPAGEIGVPSHFHIAFQNSNISVPYNDLFLGDDFNFFKLGAYATGTTIGTNNRNGGNQFNWTFGTDGTLTVPGNVIFPTLTVNLHNGGDQQGQVLQFGDPTKQAIITGPTPANDNNAQRLIIQGQRGSGEGEGGDVYLWAGDSDSNGGDIKIYAGDADAVPGNGGYINIDAGNGYAYGGNLTLSAGNSALYGGNVTISAGSASQGQAGQVYLNTSGGSLTLASDGNLTASNNIILSKPVTTVTQTITGTVYDNQQNPFTFRILKSANPQLAVAFADPNFKLKWTGTDAGSQAAAQQAPTGMGNGSLVSDDGTFWNFNSWFGLGGSNLQGSIFTVEYGAQVNYTTISTTSTNLRLQAGNNHWTFNVAGNLELPSGGTVTYSPATPSDWSGTPPTTIQEAIDRLAALVKSLNSGTGA